jgi:hypothetical protein
VLPETEEEKWVKFASFNKILPVPFVIYADFESYTLKLEGPCNDPKRSSTHDYESHEPSGFAYLVVCSDPILNAKYKPVVYRGPKVVPEFLNRLRNEQRKIYDILQRPKKMIITVEQEKQFLEAVSCYLCNRQLGEDRVRDHDHLNGKYRGAAHSNCNLQLQFRQNKRSKKFYVPVVFHNLRGYDGHFIIKYYEPPTDYEEKIECIPTNEERYLSISIGNLRFIDSLQFLSASLDKLSSNLNRGDFVHVGRHIPADKVSLMTRKGVFPYDYWDGEEKATETSLPSRKDFSSRLTGEDCSPEDYEHAKLVW